MIFSGVLLKGKKYKSVVKNAIMHTQLYYVHIKMNIVVIHEHIYLSKLYIKQE